MVSGGAWSGNSVVVAWVATGAGEVECERWRSSISVAMATAKAPKSNSYPHSLQKLLFFRGFCNGLSARAVAIPLAMGAAVATVAGTLAGAAAGVAVEAVFGAAVGESVEAAAGEGDAAGALPVAATLGGAAAGTAAFCSS